MQISQRLTHTELNELIYIGAKLISRIKSVFPLGTKTKNTKHGLDEKTKMKQQTNVTMQLKEINQK